MQQKQKVMTAASSMQRDFTRFKKKQVLIKKQQLFLGLSAAELVYMSLRLLVAKHPGAKVLFFSLFFSVCSAAATKCLIFLCSTQTNHSCRCPEILKTSIPLHQSIFSPGFPRLHKALMIQLFAESRFANGKQQTRHLFMWVEHRYCISQFLYFQDNVL